ncbi:MAG: HAMP domain-containing protein [Bacillota bacterium]
MGKRTGSRSITFKMSFSMALLIVFLMAVVGYGNYYSTSETIRIQSMEKGWSIVRSGTAFAAGHLQAGNPDLLREHLQNIQANEDVTYAAIINAAGKIVAHTDPKQVGKTAAFMGAPPTEKTVSHYTDAKGNPIGNNFLSPIVTKGGSLLGYFQLGLDNSRHQALLADIAINMLLISFAAVVAGIMLARVMARRILRQPIEDLKTATEHIAAGDFAHQVPVRRMDELGSLAAAFNSMTGHLGNLFMLVRTSATELTRSSQVILSRSEDFRLAAEKNRQNAEKEFKDSPEAELNTKKQIEALQEITSSARRMARLVDRLNSLSLQFKL